MAEQRSATQVYREVQRDQTLAHVARIRELEAQVGGLQTELARLRGAGGSQELSQLPAQVLTSLLRVFEAVPIPDLSAWESRQALQRLDALLGEQQLSAGAWSLCEGTPALEIEEGDGATVARTVAAMAQVLSETAARYLAQMIEFQGVTPDHVSRARASLLLDVSSQLDAKEQYGLLPPDHQRQLFETSIDELIQAKDQLYTVTRWLGEARTAMRAQLERLGGAAPRDASLASVVEALVACQEQVPAQALGADLRTLVRDYAALLPEPELLKTLELSATPWQERFQGAAAVEAGLSLLGHGLAAVLIDHEQVAAALRPTAVRSRERAALKRLANNRTSSPARARGALGELRDRLGRVEQAEAQLASSQRDLVKRHSRAIERAARARIAASERPGASAAAFERLSKPERNAHLAQLRVQQVEELADLLGQGLDDVRREAHQALVASVGDDHPEQVGARRAALERLRVALREPPEQDELELTAPIDVEDGLLNRQAEDLASRVAALLGKYSKAKRAGMRSLAEATATLAEVDGLARGKRAALDALLKKAYRGKGSPKQEAALAAALLEEQQELEAGRARLAERKRLALDASGSVARAAGLSLPDYDTLWDRVGRELARLDVAGQALAALDARQDLAREVAGQLEGTEVESLGAARAALMRGAAEAAQLRELADRLSAERQGYLEQAQQTLRKAPKSFAAAKATCEDVAQELRLVDALRNGERTYVAGFAQRGGPQELSTVSSWVKRERKKADQLAELIADSASKLQKSARKLTQLEGVEPASST